MADLSDELSGAQLKTLRSGLRFMALRALGDVDAAEEAVQESLARTVEAVRAGRGPEPGKLGAFAAGIARHVTADLQRARHRTVPLDEASPAAPASSDPDPLTALISADERGRLRAAMTKLSPKDRYTLRLTFFEGLTPSELAARSGEPAERVRKRKSRALQRLRRAFLGSAAQRHESRARPTEEGAEGLVPPARPGGSA